MKTSLVVTGKHGCDRKRGEQKEKRGGMEGREAHSELWSGNQTRETYSAYTSTRTLGQIIWNTHRKSQRQHMLCSENPEGLV